MASELECKVCGTTVGVKKRSCGYPACYKCNLEIEDYQDHWFVKSLKYTKPHIPNRRKVKSDGAQRELFESEEFLDG